MIPVLSKETTLSGVTLPTKPLKVIFPDPVLRIRSSAPALVPFKFPENVRAWLAVIIVTSPEITTGSLNTKVASPNAVIFAPTEILAPLVSITRGSTTLILAEMVI